MTLLTTLNWLIQSLIAMTIISMKVGGDMSRNVMKYTTYTLASIKCKHYEKTGQNTPVHIQGYYNYHGNRLVSFLAGEGVLHNFLVTGFNT